MARRGMVWSGGVGIYLAMPIGEQPIMRYCLQHSQQSEILIPDLVILQIAIGR